jgi:hypothetical protein
MYKVILLLLCLTTSVIASIKQQNVVPSTANKNNKAVKQLFLQDESVDIEKVFELKLNEEVVFKVSNTELIYGTVTRIEKTDKDIVIFGTLSSKEKAGFIFRFTSPNLLAGVLFFVEKGFVYNLKQTKESIFVFEKQEIKIRNNEVTSK